MLGWGGNPFAQICANGRSRFLYDKFTSYMINSQSTVNLQSGWPVMRQGSYLHLRQKPTVSKSHSNGELVLSPERQ